MWFRNPNLDRYVYNTDWRNISPFGDSNAEVPKVEDESPNVKGKILGPSGEAISIWVDKRTVKLGFDTDAPVCNYWDE